MQSRFEVTFPLILESENSFTITFVSQSGQSLKFNKGIYYLLGDNGSGKTTFLNMLALISGTIGKNTGAAEGTIHFNGEAYNGRDFNYIRAADIREQYFCIFPQKAFFLPVSSHDNYWILNGSDEKKALSFSTRQYPDFLSGGQQQKILMDIILDDKKPVWFLDEPLSNLDAERRHYFWKTLDHAFQHELKTVLFIDHWMGGKIRDDPDFKYTETVRVRMKYTPGSFPAQTEKRDINIFYNQTPQKFLARQIRKQ